MKKIKLQLEPGQMLILAEMMKVLLLLSVCEPWLLLERLVVIELYRRQIARFTLADGKPLTLAYSEALALNRIMQAMGWTVPGAGGVATEIIRQIDPILPAMLEKKPKFLLK